MEQRKKTVPRRGQQREQEQERREQEQREQEKRQRARETAAAAPEEEMPLPERPHSSADLRRLLRQYGGVLTPENKQFIRELITHLEQGGDQDSLLDLAGRMQNSLNKQQ